jgi:hypothetical protein
VSTASASLERLQARHWGLVALLVVVAAATGRPGLGGVLLGGGAMGLVVAAYAAAARAVLRRGSRRLAIALLFAKLAAFSGLGWLALTSGRGVRPDPIGFALGLSCFPLAAVWEAMRTRGSRWSTDSPGSEG